MQSIHFYSAPPKGGILKALPREGSAVEQIDLLAVDLSARNVQECKAPTLLPN